MYARAVAVELRARGNDVLWVHEADPVLVGASDAEMLSAAVATERVLVTQNVRDFRPLDIAILEGGDHHHGIVYTSDRQFPRGDPATNRPSRPGARRARAWFGDLARLLSRSLPAAWLTSRP